MSSYLLLCSKAPQRVVAYNSQELLSLTTLWVGWVDVLISPGFTDRGTMSWKAGGGWAGTLDAWAFFSKSL